MSRQWILGFCLVLAVLMPTLAGADNNLEPEITDTHVNPVQNTVIIQGERLQHLNETPKVELKTNDSAGNLVEFDLFVISAAETVVTADLPFNPPLADGAYEIELETTQGDDKFVLVIGAIGPQGPPGADGADGVPCTIAPNGDLTCSTGTVNVKGPKGDPGDLGGVIDQTKIYKRDTLELFTHFIDTSATPQTTVAFCDDENDLYIAGGCEVIPSDLRITKTLPLAPVAGAPWGQRCDFGHATTAKFTINISATIYCLSILGP